MEEGSLSRRLAFDCRHGYSQEEYVMKTDRERERERERETERARNSSVEHSGKV